jgi:NADPH2:quinone reductase
VIGVAAAGVNFPDVLIIENKYQFKPPLPFSPGGEVAGVVRAVGPEVTAVGPGDRVIGSVGFGGFAEEVLCDASRCIPFPDAMDFVTASGFVMTYGTSHHALKDRARLRPGETLLVLGAAGGVGLAAVELGALMGARVVAAASSPEKVDVARGRGAALGLVYPPGPLDRDAQRKLSDDLKALAGGDGIDVIYDPVGGDYAEPALRAINWEGRFLVIGFAAGSIPKVPLNLTLLKGCEIVGVFWGAFTAREPARNAENLAELMRWYVEGRLRPLVSRTYPLEQAARALNDMAARRVTGKVVLTTGR